MSPNSSAQFMGPPGARDGPTRRPRRCLHRHKRRLAPRTTAGTINEQIQPTGETSPIPPK